MVLLVSKFKMIGMLLIVVYGQVPNRYQKQQRSVSGFITILRFINYG